MSDDRHENYLRKNAALSLAYEFDKKEKIQDKTVKLAHEEEICSSCKQTKPCVKTRSAKTDRAEGTASFSFETVWICDDCREKKQKKNKDHKTMTKGEIKGMLKNAKKGRLF